MPSGRDSDSQGGNGVAGCRAFTGRNKAQQNAQALNRITLKTHARDTPEIRSVQAFNAVWALKTAASLQFAYSLYP